MIYGSVVLRNALTRLDMVAEY